MNFPFKIEIVDSQHQNHERPSIYGTPRTTEIDVNIRFHSSEIERLEYLRPSTRQQLVYQVIEDAKRHAYDEFIYFLQITAHAVNSFPLEALGRNRNQRYSLLMSPRKAREIAEISGISIHSDDEAIIFGGCELEVNEHPRLIDPETYLVASDRYVLLLYPSLNVQSVDIYRSDFIELNQASLPPISMHSQIVIETIQHLLEPTRRRGRRQRRRQMMSIFELIQRNPPRDDLPPSKLLTECPKCGGRVKRLGGEDYFCMDCDWDNLKPM